MTEIAPFKAVVYNPQKIEDLTKVVCPPYDIISPSRQQYYHALNPYNLIHLLLGKDSPQEDKYRRADKYFKRWLKERILIREEKPAIYFYRQEYTLKGERMKRLGFISLLNLEGGCSSTFGHEYTHLEPKEDRLRILKSVKANLSPIFVLFSDRQRIIQRIYEQHLQGKEPFIHLVNDERITHQVWRLDNADLIQKIRKYMQDENIFIADGHHRYEVACAYREQIKRRRKTATGEESFNYIMAYFTNIESHGLTILPVHRLVKLGTRLDTNKFRSKLEDYFAVEEVRDRIRFFFLLEKASGSEHILGMYKDRRYWLLRLKNIKILERMLSDKPPEFRSVDMVILNHLIIKNILKINLENKKQLTFSNNADELIQQVDEHKSYIAFFLNSVRVQQVISVALSGEKMPPKSTYFYPKVLSGLLIHKFE